MKVDAGRGEETSLEALVALLRRAYSGELAAAHAYRGHWKSSRDPFERARIREIEEEELHHRRVVGEMLASLGRRPSFWREIWSDSLGRILGLSCHVGGWYIPMYAAGRLESGNVIEYQHAALHAANSGRGDLVECLIAMAETERDHERYFRARVLSHRASRWLRVWPAPPELDPSFATRTPLAG